MTDKRTAPPQARRKRAAPTIDLTATEVPPAAAANEPPPPAAEPEPPPQAAAEPAPPGTEPPSDDSMNKPSSENKPSLANKPSAGLGMPALAGGAAGAVLALLLILALWFTGLMPGGNAGTGDARIAGLETQVRDLAARPAGAPDTKAIDALAQRVAKIEDAVAKLPAGDPAVAEKLAAADNAMKSIGVALPALSRRSDDIAVNATQARDRAAAAEAAVMELRAAMDEAAKKAAAGMSSADLDGLQKRIAGLEQSAKVAREDIAKEIAKTGAADAAARLALSASALRDAVLSGAPYAAALAQVKALGADEKALAPLEPFAASGVPTVAALTRELRALLAGMEKTSGAEAPAGGFFERLQANAAKLVRVRPIDAAPGEDAPAVLARVETEAANADIAAALADLNKLPEAVRAPAQAWIAKAQARQAALAAVRALAADSARALGPR